jgi:hypothetical protein
MIAGGALLGFMAGGPIGMAIGAGIGAIGALTAEMRANKEQTDKSVGSMEDYAATLDQVTAATTKVTRATIYDNLQKSGMIADMRLLGLSSNDVVNSMMGQEKSVRKVGDAMSDAKAFVKDFYENNAGYAAGGMARIDALNDNHIGQIEDIIQKYGLESDAIKDSIRAVEEKSAVVNQLPKEVITHFRTEGAPKGIKDLKALQAQFKLNPKQLKTVIDLFHLEVSKKQLKDLKKAGEGAKEGLDKVGKAKPKPDMSFLDTVAKSIKKGLAQGNREIDNFAKDVRGKTRNVKPDLNPFVRGIQSGMTSAKGKASTGSAEVGTAAKNGFGNGFAGAALQWSASLAAAVRAAIAAGKAAAKAKSPSRETYDLGVDMVDGLTLAFKENGDKPGNEMSKMMKKILARVTKDIISQIGTEGFAPKMSQVLDIARDMIEKSLPKELKGDKRKKVIKTRLDDVADAIEKSMKRLDRINKKLRAKRKEIEDAVAEVDRLKGIRDSFTGAIKDFGSFSSFNLEPENITSANISQMTTSRVASLAQFGKDLQTLKGMGFSQATIDMILAMPIQDAIAYAAALVKATPAELANINANVGTIMGGGGLAESISASMYQAGIDAAQALVDGLREKEEDLEEIARRLGHKIAKAIKDELKMKSPSKVALSIAHNFGDSLGKGLRDRENNLENMSRRLAVAMQPNPSATYTNRPVVGANPGTAQAQKVVEQNITVHTQEIDPRANAQKLGWELANRTGF